MSLDDLIKKDRDSKKRQGGKSFGGPRRFGGVPHGGAPFRGGNRGDSLVPRMRRGGAGIFKARFGAPAAGGARAVRRGGRFGDFPRN